MSEARQAILERIRRSLGRGALDAKTEGRLREELENPPARLIPARGKLEAAARAAQFIEKATRLGVTWADVPAMDAVPGAVSAFLRLHAIEATQLRVAAHPSFAGLAWPLPIAGGAAEESDLVSVTRAFAGVAETGTLLACSGPETPATLNFVPTHHLVVLAANEIVGSLDDAWNLMRGRYGKHRLPRAVNLITGTSSTGDIAMMMLKPAQGPLRVHLILCRGSA